MGRSNSRSTRTKKFYFIIAESCPQLAPASVERPRTLKVKPSTLAKGFDRDVMQQSSASGASDVVGLNTYYSSSNDEIVQL